MTVSTYSLYLHEQIRLDLVQDGVFNDLSSLLIEKSAMAKADLIAKEEGVLCGNAWFDETFSQVSAYLHLPKPFINWQLKEGESFQTGDVIACLEGSARVLLGAERTALNFLQTLSATATTTRQVATWLASYDVEVLDTRKTLPSLRMAQKHAVQIGGGINHRMGLSDAFLIKENHITMLGSIKQAVEQAKALSIIHSASFIELEIERLDQLPEAIEAAPDVVMLDNFSQKEVIQAMPYFENSGISVEISGLSMTESVVKAMANCGVNRISLGSLTKHCRAIDYSLLFEVK